MRIPPPLLGEHNADVLGTWLGLEKLNQKGLLLVLSLVMTLAGAKLLSLA